MSNNLLHRVSAGSLRRRPTILGPRESRLPPSMSDNPWTKGEPAPSVDVQQSFGPVRRTASSVDVQSICGLPRFLCCRYRSPKKLWTRPGFLVHRCRCSTKIYLWMISLERLPPSTSNSLLDSVKNGSSRRDGPGRRRLPPSMSDDLLDLVRNGSLRRRPTIVWTW